MQNNQNQNWQPEQSVSYWINQASRQILKRFEQRLRGLGFGMAYLPVSLALEAQGTLTQKVLAEQVGVEQPTMAALLKRMERDAVIVRRPHPDDGRAQLFELTASGRERLPQVKACLNQEAEGFVAGFATEEQILLIDLLQKLVANLRESKS